MSKRLGGLLPPPWSQLLPSILELVCRRSLQGIFALNISALLVINPFLRRIGRIWIGCLLWRFHRLANCAWRDEARGTKTMAARCEETCLMPIETTVNYAPVTRRRNPIRSSVRYALAWAVVVLAPMIAFWLSGYQAPFADPTLRATVLAASGALFAGLFLAGRVLDLPGTRGTLHGVPIMAACFVVAALALFVFRIEYSRTLLFYSAASALLVATQMRWRLGTWYRQPFYIVPFGEAHSIAGIDGFPIRHMKRPDIPVDRRANIVADFRAELPPAWVRLLARASLAGVPVYHYKQLTESLTGQVKIESLAENSLGSLMPNRSYAPVKRLIDLVGSLVLLVILSPFMAALAALIWAEDGDSPFFLQTRTGLGGRPFRMYKFRSMTQRAPSLYDEARADAVTQDNDARITRIGGFIRQYRIDELPQLLNVLKGEMSLIGPRPEANSLADWYDDNLAFYSYRNILRPGLTGWAQINQGHVASLDDIEVKLQYDFYYIKHFSFWLDVLIVMRTIHTVLTGFGSK